MRIAVLDGLLILARLEISMNPPLQYNILTGRDWVDHDIDDAVGAGVPPDPEPLHGYSYTHAERLTVSALQEKRYRRPLPSLDILERDLHQIPSLPGRRWVLWRDNYIFRWHAMAFEEIRKNKTYQDPVRRAQAARFCATLVPLQTRPIPAGWFRSPETAAERNSIAFGVAQIYYPIYAQLREEEARMKANFVTPEISDCDTNSVAGFTSPSPTICRFPLDSTPPPLVWRPSRLEPVDLPKIKLDSGEDLNYPDASPITEETMAYAVSFHEKASALGFLPLSLPVPPEIESSSEIELEEYVALVEANTAGIETGTHSMPVEPSDLQVDEYIASLERDTDISYARLALPARVEATEEADERATTPLTDIEVAGILVGVEVHGLALEEDLPFGSVADEQAAVEWSTTWRDLTNLPVTLIDEQVEEPRASVSENVRRRGAKREAAMVMQVDSVKKMLEAEAVSAVIEDVKVHWQPQDEASRSRVQAKENQIDDRRLEDFARSAMKEAGLF
ncbi:hypothetical protein C8F01DRAFT_1155238 [Mycena amicta]|nr:hypothetical protein C8F01DRAFT_1155238 [Mycena amicta]